MNRQYATKIVPIVSSTIPGKLLSANKGKKKRRHEETYSLRLFEHEQSNSSYIDIYESPFKLGFTGSEMSISRITNSITNGISHELCRLYESVVSGNGANEESSETKQHQPSTSPPACLDPFERQVARNILSTPQKEVKKPVENNNNTRKKINRRCSESSRYIWPSSLSTEKFHQFRRIAGKLEYFVKKSVFGPINQTKKVEGQSHFGRVFGASSSGKGAKEGGRKVSKENEQNFIRLEKMNEGKRRRRIKTNAQ